MRRRLLVVALVVSTLVGFAAPAGAVSKSSVPEATAQVVNGATADDALAREIGVVALIDARQSDPARGQFCGGALVSQTAVLTAAHCVLGLAPSDVDVWLGAATLSPAGERVDVAAVSPHPGYRDGQRGNDIAVVHLAKPIGAHVATLPMLPPTFTGTGALALSSGAGAPTTVWGWGCTAWDVAGGSCAGYPVTLQQASVNILDPGSCATLYGLSPSGVELLCAGATSATGTAPDACVGDSGGPLTAPLGNRRHLLVAVVTAGFDCGYYPGLYTTAAAHHTWIVRQLAASPAASAPVTFSDAHLASAHAPGIAATAASGVAGGYPDGTYRPGNPVTRGQMATFLARALRLPKDLGAPSRDVAADDAHAGAIAAVIATGISTGYPDGTYRPGAAITRAQMATFLARSFRLPAGEALPADVAASSPHAAGIAAAVASGVAGGYPDGTFRPEQPVTRAQMATFLARALWLIA